MKYTNQEKNHVRTVNPVTGKMWSVPRNHRFWSEWGIDTAEQQGSIADADPEPTDTSGS